MRPPSCTASPAPPPADARIRDGLRYVWRRDDLLLPMVLMLVIGMAGFNFQLDPAAAGQERVPHRGGPVRPAHHRARGRRAGGRVRRQRPPVPARACTSCSGPAVGFGALELVAGLSLVVLAHRGCCCVPTGFFMIYFAQATNQRIQLGTDAAYRGRVMALFMLVFLGTTPIGAPVDRLDRPAVRRRGSAVWGGGAGQPGRRAGRAGLAAAPIGRPDPAAAAARCRGSTWSTPAGRAGRRGRRRRPARPACRTRVAGCAGMESKRLLECLDADFRRLRAVVAGADLTAMVPSCPEWTVEDLVRHVGAVYLHKVECMRLGTHPAQWPPPGLDERGRPRAAGPGLRRR